MRRFLARLANLVRRGTAEREMAREIASHLALIAEGFERAGMPPREAALAARRAYGGVEQSKELHRDARSFVWIEQLLRDVRYAWCNLWRAPGFTMVAVVALALGLGVNLTIFGVYDALILKPLPVADPDRTVRLKRWFQHHPGNDQFHFAPAEYQYLREHSTTLAGIVASYGDLDTGAGGLTVLASFGGSAVREQVRGRAVSANYFAVLGQTAYRGRFFRPEEDRAVGASPVAVLTWGCWQRRFGRDPNAVGRTIALNGLPYTIIGIAPENFTGTDFIPFEFDFWAPLSMIGQLDPALKSIASFQLLGRLKNGVSRGQAQNETSLLLRRYLASAREADPTTAITFERTRYLDPGDAGERAQMQGAAAALWIVVCLVLGAACANVANMLLARGASRQREIGIRLAMGAGPARIVRQLLLESVLLSGLGAVAAVPLSVLSGRSLWGSFNAVFRTINLSMPTPDFRPDSRVLAYGLTLAVATGVLFGLAPALRSTRLDLNRAMKGEGPVFGAQFRRSRLRAVLLASQAAVSMLLLLVSGAMTSKLRDATVSNPGFDTRNTYVLVVEGEEQRRVDLWALRDRLARLPEVAATAIGEAPSGNDDGTVPMRAGRWYDRTYASVVSDGYFETMGMRFERGRGFTRQAIESHAAVAIITESTARRCWPNEDALGKTATLTLPGEQSKRQAADFEVVGVVNDVRQADLIHIDPVRVYLPGGLSPNPDIDLMFHIRGNRGQALAAVQSAIERMDRALLPSLKMYSLEDGNIAAIRGIYRVMALVAGVLALLAVTLAVVGIQGVMSFLVSQRTREIGIRVALGATAVVLLRAIVLPGLRPVVVGMGIGFSAAVGLDAWYHSTDLLSEPLLHRVFGTPAVCAEVALMLAVAVLASLVPTRRALGVEPMRALRHE